MSGIVGLVSTSNLVPQLIRGLQQLDRPGHNACGLAVHGQARHADAAPALHRQRWAHRASQWQPEEASSLLQHLHAGAGLAYTGQLPPLGHPRIQQVLPLFSHGPNADLNSPARVAVVHQGSLHNQQALREALQDRGYTFKSQSDTEVIAHLIDATHPGDPVQAVRRTLGLLKGCFALGVMFHDHPRRVIAAQHQMPLFWGVGKTHLGCANDAKALPSDTHSVQCLQDGQLIDLHHNACTVIRWD